MNVNILILGGLGRQYKLLHFFICFSHFHFDTQIIICQKHWMKWCCVPRGEPYEESLMPGTVTLSAIGGRMRPSISNWLPAVQKAQRAAFGRGEFQRKSNLNDLSIQDRKAFPNSSFPQTVSKRPTDPSALLNTFPIPCNHTSHIFISDMGERTIFIYFRITTWQPFYNLWIELSFYVFLV